MAAAMVRPWRTARAATTVAPSAFNRFFWSEYRNAGWAIARTVRTKSATPQTPKTVVSARNTQLQPSGGRVRFADAVAGGLPAGGAPTGTDVDMGSPRAAVGGSRGPVTDAGQDALSLYARRRGRGSLRAVRPRQIVRKVMSSPWRAGGHLAHERRAAGQP